MKEDKKRVKLLKPISECEEFNSKLEKDEIKQICKKIHKSLKKVSFDHEQPFPKLNSHKNKFENRI